MRQNRADQDKASGLIDRSGLDRGDFLLAQSLPHDIKHIRWTADELAAASVLSVTSDRYNEIAPQSSGVRSVHR
jgi:hypothetical protein